MKEQVYELEGRTIKRVVESAGGDAVAFLFTDGTFAVYRGGGDDEHEWIDGGKYDLRGFGDTELIEADIATAEDMRRLRANARRREKRSTAAFHANFNLHDAMKSALDMAESCPRKNVRIIGLSL